MHLLNIHTVPFTKEKKMHNIMSSEHSSEYQVTNYQRCQTLYLTPAWIIWYSSFPINIMSIFLSCLYLNIYIFLLVKSKIVCKLPRLLNSNQPDTQQQ